MTTLRKSCNLLPFLLQLVPGIRQSQGRLRLISHVAHLELRFLHSNSYSLAQSEPFLHTEH